jgi:uncharacterized membrane protein YkoI
MSQRLTFTLAAALGTFVVVVLGALGAYLLLGGSANTSVYASQANAAAQAPSSQQSQSQGSVNGNGYALSSDDAANTALSSVPGSSLLQQPRLVNFNGTVAYEVWLDKGYVYVDATSGQVIYNGANGTQSRPRQRFRRP